MKHTEETFQIESETQRKALFQLVESYNKEEPKLMIPYFHFQVLYTAFELLKRENENLKMKTISSGRPEPLPVSGNGQ